MSDAMAVLHKLQTGLDVNVKFTGVRVFEYTPECIVFDLLDIPLYHGWLVDPQVSLTLLITNVILYPSEAQCVLLCFLNTSHFLELTEQSNTENSGCFHIWSEIELDQTKGEKLALSSSLFLNSHQHIVNMQSNGLTGKSPSHMVT